VTDLDANDKSLAEVGGRIRALRQKRQMTLQQLSDQCGVSVGMLSQMERGRSSPSVRTLQRVAEALEIPMSWFFSTPLVPRDHPSWVLPRQHRRTLSLGDMTVTKELLSPPGDGEMELLVVTIEPGGSSGPAPYTHIGEDAGLVLEGRLLLEVDGTQAILEEGDAFRFAATLPHRFENAGSGRTRVLWANTPPFY
jgi:transcriptional regulator with XRE-family HTH domain